jgi:hypothetical protein
MSTDLARGMVVGLALSVPLWALIVWAATRMQP